MIDNFEILVERCTAKRRRRMIRLSFFIVTAILLILASVAGYMTWFTSSGSTKVTDISVSIPKKPSPETLVPESNTSALPQTASPVATIRPVTPKQRVAIPINTMQVVAKKPESSPIPVISKPQNSHFFEVNTQPKSTVPDPLSAYNNNPKYETALAVARDFYSKNNFSEAAVWAKKANQLNREGEEAWLLSAQSYYAQGRKKEAIGVLELYMNYKDSKAASELLRTWNQTSAN